MRVQTLLMAAALCAACVPSNDEAEVPVVIITDTPHSQSPEPADTAPEAESTDPERACVPAARRLGLPAGARGSAAFIDVHGDVVVSWVEPGTGKAGDVQVAVAGDGEWTAGPVRTGRANLAEAPNFAGGAWSTAVAASAAGVLVAWTDVSVVSIEGYDHDHARVMARAFSPGLEPRSSADAVSDDRYEGYVVDAANPVVHAQGDRFVVAWRDTRLNEPRVYGQQAWPSGIYQSVLGSSGELIAFDEQVQQNPSVSHHGRTIAIHPDGYAFFRGARPNTPAVTGATQDALVANPAALIGSADAITAHESGLLGWSSRADSRSFVSVGMPGDEATLVDDLDNFDATLGAPRFVRGSDPPVLVWARPEGDTSALGLAVIGESVHRAPAGAPTDGRIVEIHDARVVDGLYRVVVALGDEDGERVEVHELCAPTEHVAIPRRWVTASSSATLSVAGYESDADALNVSASGTVLGAWLQLGDDEMPGVDVQLTHGAQTAKAFAHGFVDGFVGADPAGLWSLELTGNGYGYRAEGWSLRLLVED